MKRAPNDDVVDRLVADWGRETPHLDAQGLQIIGRILLLGRKYMEAANQLVAPHGLTYSDWDVVATLKRSGPPYARSPEELRQSVLLTSGAMTACLHRLEKAGLVSRTTDPEDGRRLAAKLTRKGHTLVDKLAPLRLAQARAAVADLPADQRATLTALLRKLVANESAG
ncbi:MAG: MarR family transcriptional regulator [Terricaulis sp.]